MFHVAPQGIAPGSVVAKGSWGNSMLQFREGGPWIDNHGTAIVLMWEAALETARRLVAPNAPSRYDCVFVCLTIEGARRFRDVYRPNSAIYSVEPILKSALTHTGDFDLLTTGADPFVTRMSENASLYWSAGHKPTLPEILVGSDVRVLRALA